jgi:hypothetical protein
MSKFTIFQPVNSVIEVEPNYRSLDFHKDLIRWTRRTLKVLVVVDTAVQFGENDGFGVGRFIKLLRDTTVSCTKFDVHIAQRPFVNSPGDISFVEVATPGPFEAKYIDFRFDSMSGGELVLNRYHEVFLFGFAPDNNAGPDSNITAHPWHSTDAELNVLLDWMNAGGGVFATGDHDYLGASMCHRIPRVGSMREWTNADGVPPIDGPTRLDTHQPSTPGQASGVDVIPAGSQSDATPQHIEWIPQRIERVGLWRFKYPHPILCHPVHGVINVMPDHAHEGRCEEPDTIDYTANVAFRNEPEYPTHNSEQPKPVIIAYGNILAKSNHAKGPVNAARFPMISVYDGPSNGSTVGRVVVDSTWHHWFNLNVEGFEADPDKTNWEKISRFFINIALWIAPKNTRVFCLWELLILHFEYTGVREINVNTSLLETGYIVRHALYKRFGKCWTKEFVIGHICRHHPLLCGLIKEFDPRDELGWPIDIRGVIQPQFEVIETVVLGQIYREIEPVANELRANMATKNAKTKFVLRVEELEKITEQATASAVKMLQSTASKELAELQKAFA